MARDAAICSIVETHSLSILFVVYHHETEDVVGIPFSSWVPRLHKAWDPDVDASTTLARAGDFDAFPGGPDTPDFKSLFTEDPNVLRLQGILLDPIVDVSPVFTRTCLDSTLSLTVQIKEITSIIGVAEVEDPTSLVCVGHCENAHGHEDTGEHGTHSEGLAQLGGDGPDSNHELYWRGLDRRREQGSRPN